MSVFFPLRWNRKYRLARVVATLARGKAFATGETFRSRFYLDGPISIVSAWPYVATAFRSAVRCRSSRSPVPGRSESSNMGTTASQTSRQPLVGREGGEKRGPLGPGGNRCFL